MSNHVNSNKEHFPAWLKEANSFGSRVFLCLGVNKEKDIQVFPVQDLELDKVPAILREAADIIEGIQKSKILMK